MASAYSMNLQAQADGLKRKVKLLINNHLKAICKNEKLGVSGVKATLQTRVIDHIQRCVQRNDSEAINRLSYEINNQGNTPTTGTPIYNISSSPPDASAYNMTNGYAAAAHSSPSRSQPGFHSRTHYKKSPFYDILEAVTRELELPRLEGHRQMLHLKMSLTQMQVDRLKNDPNVRLMLFCTGESTMGGSYTGALIAFPSQLEIKVNGDEVKSNFKGLKNKPGSTRPADITSLSRRKIPNYQNEISVMYALTKETYFMQVMMVRKHAVAELTERIRRGSVITKQRVLNEMLKKANDPDIEATSTTLSLKDPISTLRINVPCRSTICNHNQCFDANFFLELQEQAPTWTCPICNKIVTFEGLAIDQYVQEILQLTSKSTDQVTVEPTGIWKPTGQSSSDSRNSGQDDDDEDSDDLVEIPRYQNKFKTETPATPFSFTNTPPLPEPVPTPRNTGVTAGSKRKSEVIDLTLSDDDDPAPKRPAYRATNSASSFQNPLQNGYSTAPTTTNNAFPPNGVAPFRMNVSNSNSPAISFGQPSRAAPTHDWYRGPTSGYGR